ncbi:hypothetical protein ACQJBY_040605 [Aegilops geniculata]
MTSNPRSSASLFFSPTPTGDGGEVKIPHQPDRLPADGGLSQAPPAVSRLDGAAPPRRRVPAAAAPFGPARLPSGLHKVEWKAKKVRSVDGDRGGGVRAAAGRAGGGPVGAAGAGGRGGQASPMAGRATRAGGRRQARLGPPGRCLRPLRRGLRRVRRLLPR